MSEIEERVARLQKLMHRAEPLPWVWEQCGEKEDAPVIGVAFDKDGNALSGELPDHGDEISRWNIASEWGSGIDASAPSANAAFVVEAVNLLPELIAAYNTEAAIFLKRYREALELAQKFGPRVGQMMDSIKAEWSQSGNWTEWDQQVRDEATAMMLAIDAALKVGA